MFAWPCSKMFVRIRFIVAKVKSIDEFMLFYRPEASWDIAKEFEKP